MNKTAKESKCKSRPFVIWEDLYSPGFAEIIDVTVKPYNLVAVFALMLLGNSNVCVEREICFEGTSSPLCVRTDCVRIPCEGEWEPQTNGCQQ